MRTGMAVAAVLMLGAGAGLAGEKLEVGPGKKYALPSEAIKAARDGDTIEIDAQGVYEGDVAKITVSGLTIRGVGEGRAKLDPKGKTCESQGMFIQAETASDLTFENIEFNNVMLGLEIYGNGAAIRSHGTNLTVRNCKFYHCQDTIQGCKGNVLVEHCEFSYCGLGGDSITHNIYIGPKVDKLVYRYNYSHQVKFGSLLKSRAKESFVLYNRLTDEDGSGCFVADFPNGGKVYVIGNVMEKGAKADNRRVIAYNKEGFAGLKSGDTKAGRHMQEFNELYVINNVLINNYPREDPYFIEVLGVEGMKHEFKMVVRNNIFAGAALKKAPLCTWPKAVMEGNFTEGDPMFVDPANYDFRLKPGSPCIDKGVDPGKAGEVDLRPVLQYVHPCKEEKRPDDGKIDIGAYEFQPPAGK